MSTPKIQPVGSDSSHAKIYTIGFSPDFTALMQDPEPVADDLAAAHKTGCCTAAHGLKVSSAYSTTVEGSRGSGPLGLMALPEPSFDLLAKVDLTELGGKIWGQPWLDQLTRLKIRDGTQISSVVAIIGTRGLIVNRKITRESFDHYVSRLKSMTPDLIQHWRDAIKKSALSVSDLVLIHFLVAHDPLFTNSSEALRARELNRFRSIPSEALSVWTAATGYPAIDCAFELLRVESLFSGEAFAKERFDVALPVAKRQISGEAQ